MAKQTIALDGIVKTKVKPTPAPAPEPEPESEGGRPLNFRVTKDFRRRFRIAAAEADISLSSLLRECFDAWLEKQKGKQ